MSALSWLRGAISCRLVVRVLRESFSLVTVTKETSQHFGVVCAIVSERRSSVFLELGLKFALAGHLSCDSTFLVWPQSSNSMPGRYQRRCSLGYRGIFFYRGKIDEYTHLRATWLQTLYQWGTVSDGYYLWLVVRECKHHPRKAVLGFLTAVLLLPSLSAPGSGWFFWHKNHALRYGLNSLEMSCLEVVVPFSWGNFCQRQGRDLFQQSIQDSRFLQTTFTTKLSLYLYTSAISATTSPPSVLATDYSEKMVVQIQKLRPFVYKSLPQQLFQLTVYWFTIPGVYPPYPINWPPHPPAHLLLFFCPVTTVLPDFLFCIPARVVQLFVILSCLPTFLYDLCLYLDLLLPAFAPSDSSASPCFDHWPTKLCFRSTFCLAVICTSVTKLLNFYLYSSARMK